MTSCRGKQAAPCDRDRLDGPERPAGGQADVAALGRWRRRGYLALGMLMVALGAVGAVLPVMPTTVFLIAAAACFGRASPALEARLLRHPRFGPAIVAWREQGAIPLAGKGFAVAGMALGFGVFWVWAQPAPWLAALVGVFMAACALWVATRPLPRRDERDAIR